ncbi:Cytochrome P450 monooxygenase [Pseudocercospora fuligena]|uniref:Cytochrome P450 monooxygenase n=1 Tax=Pseudocercospora fuligena TaxID=685502 RepID=A0A8H6R776_9PEZI|nr:Cytochrome P450 monooxygenase [Pseudocercospora fuligena]
MLVEKDVEKLRVQKRFAGPVYSIQNATKHEGLVDNNLRRMLRRFTNLVQQKSKSIDIYYEFEILNVDIMSEFTFGREYGAVEKSSDDGHMASMDSMWAWWGWIGFLPWLNEIDKSYSPWSILFSLTAPKRFPVFPYAVGKCMEYEKATEMGEKASPCLLDDLRTLSRNRPEFKDNWGMRLALTDLGAGVDTMSWTLAAFIVGIGQNPEVYAKLREELDSAGLIKGEPVPYEEAAKLSYFQACLHECLRMWPNIAISIPRDVPAGGIEIDGYFIPEGYTVGMNSKVLGLNGDVFGSEPERFRPERWLEADKLQRDSMENKNLSFGGSSRKCPGMHVAWFCMSKLLATLYFNFEVKLLNELNGKPGPAGHVWREVGSFPTKWHGLEARLVAR